MKQRKWTITTLLSAFLLTATAFAAGPTINLMPTADDGVPEGYTEEEWLGVSGSMYAEVVDDENYTVTVEASGLVPDGLYTLWWMSEGLVGMSMGPAGGVPDNEFRADADGNATVTITVSQDNEYDMIALAYHADDETHGEEPGALGDVTFGHLMGPFPRGLSLNAIDGDGIPEGHSEDEWFTASGATYVSDITDDSYTVTVEASGLVSDGLYTLWWITEGIISTDMGPAGGVPDNEFRADADGNASLTITVDADNDYGALAIAYHADDETHGDTPGELGEITFGHLMSDFPRP